MDLYTDHKGYSVLYSAEFEYAVGKIYKAINIVRYKSSSIDTLDIYYKCDEAKSAIYKFKSVYLQDERDKDVKQEVIDLLVSELNSELENNNY